MDLKQIKSETFIEQKCKKLVELDEELINLRQKFERFENAEKRDERMGIPKDNIGRQIWRKILDILLKEMHEKGKEMQEVMKELHGIYMG